MLPLVHLLLALAQPRLQLLRHLRDALFPRAGHWPSADRRAHHRCDVAYANRRSLCMAVCIDTFLSRASRAIIDSLPAKFERLQKWIPAIITLAALLATFLSLPTNCGVPKFNLSQNLLSPAPLDPQRLYLSIYPPPDTAYGFQTDPRPLGQIIRPAALQYGPGFISLTVTVQFVPQASRGRLALTCTVKSIPMRQITSSSGRRARVANWRNSASTELSSPMKCSLFQNRKRNGSWFIPPRKVASITDATEYLHESGRFPLWTRGLTSNSRVRR